MKFLEKIQKLPLEKRKIILWVATIIIGSILSLLWWKIFIIKK